MNPLDISNPNERQLVKKVMTLAGGTVNDPGDFDGTGNPAALFVVTGDVLVEVFAVCGVDLVGASATIEVGTVGATAAIIAQTTAANIDAGMGWDDNGPGIAEAHTLAQNILSGQDIIQTVGTANITAGALTYYCYWTPLSAGATVVAA